MRRFAGAVSLGAMTFLVLLARAAPARVVAADLLAVGLDLGGRVRPVPRGAAVGGGLAGSARTRGSCPGRGGADGAPGGRSRLCPPGVIQSRRLVQRAAGVGDLRG